MAKLASKMKKPAQTVIDTPIIYSKTEIIAITMIQEYFSSKIGRKNKNIQPGPEKQYSYTKKECRSEKLCRMGYDIPNVHCPWRLQFISSHFEFNNIILFTEKLFDKMHGIPRTCYHNFCYHFEWIVL